MKRTLMVSSVMGLLIIAAVILGALTLNSTAQPPAQEPAPRFGATDYCKLDAEQSFNRAWIQACIEDHLLSAHCQELFDPRGYPKDTSIADEDAAQKIAHYQNDVVNCRCELPEATLASLQAQLDDSTHRCATLSPTLQ